MRVPFPSECPLVQHSAKDFCLQTTATADQTAASNDVVVDVDVKRTAAQIVAKVYDETVSK